jgi:hypothetical protein
MPWKLNKLPHKESYSELKPGDYVETPLTTSEAQNMDWSPQFLASGRTSVFSIRLPGNCGLWSPDQRASGADDGWTLTLDEHGEPLSAHPSVNANGWLRDGVLSDDVEGRTYPS